MNHRCGRLFRLMTSTKKKSNNMIHSRSKITKQENNPENGQTIRALKKGPNGEPSRWCLVSSDHYNQNKDDYEEWMPCQPRTFPNDY